jgi:hypothetical protein
LSNLRRTSSQQKCTEEHCSQGPGKHTLEPHGILHRCETFPSDGRKLREKSPTPYQLPERFCMNC